MRRHQRPRYARRPPPCRWVVHAQRAAGAQRPPPWTAAGRPAHRGDEGAGPRLRRRHYDRRGRARPTTAVDAAPPRPSGGVGACRGSPPPSSPPGQLPTRQLRGVDRLGEGLAASQQALTETQGQTTPRSPWPARHDDVGATHRTHPGPPRSGPTTAPPPSPQGRPGPPTRQRSASPDEPPGDHPERPPEPPAAASVAPGSPPLPHSVAPEPPRPRSGAPYLASASTHCARTAGYRHRLWHRCPSPWHFRATPGRVTCEGSQGGRLRRPLTPRDRQRPPVPACLDSGAPWVHYGPADEGGQPGGAPGHAPRCSRRRATPMTTAGLPVTRAGRSDMPVYRPRGEALRLSGGRPPDRAFSLRCARPGRRPSGGEALRLSGQALVQMPQPARL